MPVTRLIYLKSVGTFLDPVAKLVYPANLDGGPDLTDGCDPEDDLAEEWRASLSALDAEVFRKAMRKRSRPG